MNSLEKITKKYLTYWKDKNIKEFSKLFHDEIVLQDWDNLITGKKALIKFNQEFFKKVNQIDLNIINLNSSKTTSFSELKIDIDGNKLIVLDRIDFDEKLLIKKIRAFKG